MSEASARSGCPRIGLIGARRTRMGLGPFVARELRRCGAEVPALVGTTPESVDDACRALRESKGTAPRGYLDLAEMLKHEELDALAILSPSPTHEEYLRAASEAGLHVLCEKPLLAMGRDEGAAQRARLRVEDFAARGKLLWENCQWPFTLPAYVELCPGILSAERLPDSFFMRLSPTHTGVGMVEQVLSHALSLLQAACGVVDARVREVEFESLANRGVGLRFDFVTTRGVVASVVELIPRSGGIPSMGYGFDGAFAERCVEPGSYAMSLRCAGHQVAVPDPLAQMIEAFVGALQGIRPSSEGWHPGLGLDARMEMLARLHFEYENSEIQDQGVL